LQGNIRQNRGGPDRFADPVGLQYEHDEFPPEAISIAFCARLLHSISSYTILSGIEKRTGGTRMQRVAG
jgi:hypothetical protein